MRRSRRRQPPPDLTSLFDVLFIVIFAALIRAAAVQQAAAQPAPPKVVPPPTPIPLEVAALHARAMQTVDARPALVVRVDNGAVVALETADKSEHLDTPLLEHSPDPDIGIAYLGDRSSEQRICRIAALHLGVADLSAYLVVIAPAQHLADLPHALYEGLRRDVDRCLTEQRGLAVIVGPETKP